MLTREEVEFLENLLKKKEYNYRYILKNKFRYTGEAIERSEKGMSLIASILEKLQKLIAKPEQTDIRKFDISRIDRLEDRISKLEAWQAGTQPIIQKLVAYHSGEM